MNSGLTSHLYMGHAETGSGRRKTEPYNLHLHTFKGYSGIGGVLAKLLVKSSIDRE